jgi:TctA family transporter
MEVMEYSMMDAALKALGIMLTPERMGFLFGGVLLGLVIGVIPGLGGLVGLSLILPFTFDMNPYTALAFMLGLQSVTATGDTIPAVLFGVPGTVASAATIMDGYPMAKKGEAGRALGASFTSNIMGGLFGALLLGISIPILRPVVLYIGSPELLSFCIFGISLVAVLSGSSPAKGMAAACLGILVATTGDDPQTGTLRWTFDSLYLWDGLPIVPLALGIFALPELGDLAIANKSIFSGGKIQSASKGQMQGVRDAFKNWFLVLRCSMIGAGLGAVPGIGASVIDWVAYGHAARTEKGAKETFARGDVRGVIASESSNNAKEGGALVPTVAFGVPGSASMALILGAFLIHGIVPGPDMLTKNLDITYTLVWSVAMANILGAGICFLLANQMAKLALVRAGILVPTVVAITFVGAFQGSRAWGDIYALLLFGVLGWIMKRFRWPRPPLILGFVLGGLIERYMFISVERYAWEWLLHPIVVVVLIITLWGLCSPLISEWRARRQLPPAEREAASGFTFGFQRERLGWTHAFAGGVIAVFSSALIVSSSWEFGARLVPQVTSYTGLLFAVLFLVGDLFFKAGKAAVIMPGASAQKQFEAKAHEFEEEVKKETHFDLAQDFGDLSTAEITRRACVYFGWLLGYVVIAHVVGLLGATLLYMVLYMRYQARESWKLTLVLSGSLIAGYYGLFHQVLIVPWPQSLVGELFPVLRTMHNFNLF